MLLQVYRALGLANRINEIFSIKSAAPEYYFLGFAYLNTQAISVKYRDLQCC